MFISKSLGMRSHLIAPLIHALLRQRKLISQNLTFAELYLREKHIFHLASVSFLDASITKFSVALEIV
jgi:hypothetical protein